MSTSVHFCVHISMIRTNALCYGIYESSCVKRYVRKRWQLQAQSRSFPSREKTDVAPFTSSPRYKSNCRSFKCQLHVPSPYFYLLLLLPYPCPVNSDALGFFIVHENKRLVEEPCLIKCSSSPSALDFLKSPFQFQTTYPCQKEKRSPRAKKRKP